MTHRMITLWNNEPAGPVLQLIIDNLVANNATTDEFFNIVSWARGELGALNCGGFVKYWSPDLELTVRRLLREE